MKLKADDKYFSDEEKARTPDRWADIFNEFDSNQEFNFTVFDNPGYDQMIILKDIDYASMCSHHLLPFTGVAHIGYVPDKKICGISKLARVVDKFASRPQLQERMTNEIADFLMENLDPIGVIVVVSGGHQCMRIRGVKKSNSIMITSAIRGKFQVDGQMKEEFFSLIKD